ncbi:unnamed protein product [Trichogramma brassicae]|uniref:Uncharacterized protein n=1 Tax=Trichogramma brassicae TaxID=86971 RepID=A0A6H5HTX0_9HYME|nr:unnamed protein product [Trichogramma brassicae]
MKTLQRLELATLEKNLCSCSWIICTCADRCPGKFMGTPITRAVWHVLVYSVVVVVTYEIQVSEEN